MFADTINISAEWLSIDKQDLKILVLASLSDNAEYKGNLKSICNWLGVSSCAVNNDRIKEALKSLSDNGYISYSVAGRTYTITINEIKTDNIVPIRKKWIDEFMKYNKDENGKNINKNNSIDWIQILRVFAFLYHRNNNDIITQAEIAEQINNIISVSTISTAIEAIRNCHLQGIIFKAEAKRHKKTDESGNEIYRTEGTEFSIMLNFEDM